jgi:superfamily II DNA or RNA helicase
MPTGTGKTRLFTSIIHDINEYSIQRREAVKILIIAHRTELIDQIDESLERYKVAHGIIAGSRKKDKDYKVPVQVASIQTLTNKYNIGEAEKLNAQFVIIDEAHHALASTYKRLWEIYPNAKWLGVTATPWRMNHKGFTDLFNTIILSQPIKDFIKQGYLSTYKYFSLRNDSSIKKKIGEIEIDRFGEYKEASMQEKMDIGSIRAQLLNSYLTFAKGKRGIIYAININHAKHICQEYQNAGFNAVSIDSKTPASERKELVGKFKNKEIDIIVNVDVFSEGFDCPDIEFIQLARPTLSLVKYLQQVGRGLRPTKNKENCVILDNVGMYANFGLPDEHRLWNYFFLGKNVSDSPLRSLSKSSIGHRNVNTSEGTEDMELIQDAFEDSYITSADQAILNLPPEMYVHEYSFRKVGKCPIEDELSDSLNDGIILGWTTVKEAFELGGEYSKDKDNVQHIKINDRDYSDVDGDGILKKTTVYLRDKLPEYLANKGLYFSLSFNEIISRLKKEDFYYKIVEKDRFNDLFMATVKAKDIVQSLDLELNFIGTKGKKESDSNTLVFIEFSRSRILTDRSDYSPFLPIEGVTIGQTTSEDLKSFGFDIFKDSCTAVTKKRPVIYFNFNGKSTKVERIRIPGEYMPVEWPEAKTYAPMTYRKWLSYFEKYGFDLKKNDALNPSIYFSPQLTAVQPQIGIKVTITLISLFKVKREANNPKSIMECEITLI